MRKNCRPTGPRSLKSYRSFLQDVGPHSISRMENPLSLRPLDLQLQNVIGPTAKLLASGRQIDVSFEPCLLVLHNKINSSPTNIPLFMSVKLIKH